MGWNGSNGKIATPTPTAPKSKRWRKVSKVVLSVSVVVCAAIMACFFVREKNDESSARQSSHAIAERTTSVSPDKIKGSETDEPLYATRFWELDASKTNGFSEGMMRKWKIAHRPRPKELPKATYKKDRYAIFNHRSENAIAGLLMHKPGQGMIGTPVYGEKFEQDFLESCQEPIIIDANDDEYSRNLKQLMRDTKIELRQRMANGENLSQILLDTHKELQKLGQVRQSIEKEMRNAIKENAATEADVDDYFDAANVMLESNGLAPMKPNPILKKSLMHLLVAKEIQ